MQELDLTRDGSLEIHESAVANIEPISACYHSLRDAALPINKNCWVAPMVAWRTPIHVSAIYNVSISTVAATYSTTTRGCGEGCAVRTSGNHWPPSGT